MTQTPDLLMETPFFDDAAPGPSGIDVLSDILRVFHVTGAALLRGEFGAPWAWHAPPSSEIANLLHPGAMQLIIFHIVAEGSCWVEVDGEERCNAAVRRHRRVPAWTCASHGERQGRTDPDRILIPGSAMDGPSSGRVWRNRRTDAYCLRLFALRSFVVRAVSGELAKADDRATRSGTVGTMVRRQYALSRRRGGPRPPRNLLH